jgi:hypothetical protein
MDGAEGKPVGAVARSLNSQLSTLNSPFTLRNNRLARWSG